MNMLNEACRKRLLAAEGVTLSGAVLVRLYADSAPEKSTQMGTEGENLRTPQANLSGKRTEIFNKPKVFLFLLSVRYLFSRSQAFVWLFLFFKKYFHTPRRNNNYERFFGSR